MAIVQLRHETDRRRYYDRRVAEGKTPMEAMRALKRRLSDVVYRQLVNDQKRQRQSDIDPQPAPVTGPGGHAGTITRSCAAGSNPSAGASDKSLPEPAALDVPPTLTASPDRFLRAPAALRQRRPQPGSSRFCLTLARTGAPSTGGTAPLTTEGCLERTLHSQPATVNRRSPPSQRVSVPIIGRSSCRSTH